ncbi:MAG TPA: UDP-N-acetylmuramoyl-L-alanyl-D-glutamate--2,6-diaminopimelate ligase [Lentimicrobium sp.]|nr:UDP-N-acetylmuramoyl-L-alanyl-D-glutamate--2,6-diaminopimelate ligase [Lentimicrobium sp.]
MRKLKDILYRCSISRVVGNNDIPIAHITFDSRDISNESVFVAIQGTITDGHKYIPQVIEKGVTAIVCERLPEEIINEVCYVVVKDSSETLAYMACNFYNNPSEKLHLIGITGTNGKTTTATLLYELFKQSGYKTGLLSTVRNCVNNKEYPATHTTPDPLHLNALLAEMVEEGCQYCFMEVSSHSIVQNRITGLQFRGGIFSNLTHDHLDFHKTFDAYLQAKKQFFDKLPASAFALINIDDRNGSVMVQNTKAKTYTMAVKKVADFHCKILENQFDGLLLNINGKEVWCHLVGNFNAYNLLAIYSTARILGIEEDEALVALSKLRPVDGRFEYFKSPEGVVGIVDYAHTPDALKNVIETINTVRSGNGRLITVVGAGGDRDKSKRPIMAKIAAEGSNIVILTSDNPRSEEPEVILNEMNEGIPIDKKKKSLVITDRKQAIKTACTMAENGDVILIAGKGHETYQEISGVKHHFDDREILKEIFNIEKGQN